MHCFNCIKGKMIRTAPKRYNLKRLGFVGMVSVATFATIQNNACDNIMSLEKMG